MSGAPHDVAVVRGLVRRDDEIKRSWDTEGIVELQARAGLRDVAHDAPDTTGAVECDRAGLVDPVTRTPSSLLHGQLLSRGSTLSLILVS